MPPKGRRTRKQVGGEYEIAGNFMQDVSDFTDNYVKPAINVAETAAPYVAKYAPLLLGLGQGGTISCDELIKIVVGLGKRVKQMEDELHGLRGGARNSGVNGFKQIEQEPSDVVFKRQIPTIRKDYDYEAMGDKIAMEEVARGNNQQMTRAERSRQKLNGGDYETGGRIGRSPFHDIMEALK